MTAPETSFRPKTRNLPKKDKSLAPLESLRPVTRSDAQDEKNQMNEAFGNLEFRADMDKQLSWNPLARLGFNPNKTKVLRTNKSAFDARISDADTKEYQLSLIKKGYPEEEAARVEEGDIVISADAANNPTIAHEYTHEGLRKVYALAEKDPNLFMAKYGEDSLRLVLRAKPFRKPMRSRQPDEYLTELFDDVNTMFNSAGIGKTLIEREKFPNKSIKFTVSSSDDDSRFIDTRSMLQDKLKGTDKGITEKSITNYNKDIKGIFGIMKAAQDMLTEQGEPPKSKVIELSLFDKIKKKLGFNEGGVVPMDNQMRMFAEGGLSEEGGIADDGMNRDPVSGNEIPPGSLAEEVRDDVPAQLSEGEYVVPADVVRFFGVKYFEDLRMVAKQGLQQMEQDGRIGGEPMSSPAPQPADDALSPEEEALLQEIMAMEQQPQPPMQQQMQQTGMAQGGVVYAAEGVSVQGNNNLTEDIAIGGNKAVSTETNTGKKGMSSSFYIHPDGRRVRILTLNGKPLGSSPEDFADFVLDTPENRVTINYQVSEQTSGVAGGAGSAGSSGAVDGATGRTSVAVGETYTKPNGESATRMPAEYYEAGGDADQKRAMDDFVNKKPVVPTFDSIGINGLDPLAGATLALEAGKSAGMAFLNSVPFGGIGLITSGINTLLQADAISTAYGNLRQAEATGQTEVVKKIKEAITEYEKTVSSPAADFITSVAGAFVDPGENKFNAYKKLGGLDAQEEVGLSAAELAKKRAADASKLAKEKEDKRIADEIKAQNDKIAAERKAAIAAEAKRIADQLAAKRAQDNPDNTPWYEQDMGNDGGSIDSGKQADLEREQAQAAEAETKLSTENIDFAKKSGVSGAGDYFVANKGGLIARPKKKTKKKK